MADAASPEPTLDVAIDPDFEPQKRPRSCTWPLPESVSVKPVAADTDIIPEEEDDEEDGGAMAVNASISDGASSPGAPPEASANGGPATLGVQQQQQAGQQGQQTTPRKSSSRRNAWGNLSYADLITKAIESTPDKRLTLSQIYDWMVRSVPYFKDKGDSNSSAGWKNSIRHNLSLHSRFVRVQNEGTGKSSWWMINPEGGRGKAPRRRAVSMDNGNKYTKSARGRAAKKKAALQATQEGSLENVSTGGLSKWPGSPTSRSSDELDSCWTDFRSRTNSNASTISGRLSPILANPELDEVPDDEVPPLSPMLYSSPSSLSPPSSSSSNSKPCPAELPRLGTMNLNDGLTDNLMDDLLDNITLAQSTQAVQGGSAFSFGSSNSSPSTSSSSPSGGSNGGGFGNSIFGPSSTGLRQTPMQTIQENKQASFSSISHFGNATLQELLNSDSLGSHSHSDVMMTQSDPLISQTSAAVTSQSSRLRNGLMLPNDPMMSSFSSGLKGQNSLLQNNRHHQRSSTQGLLHSLPKNSLPSLANDANNIASAKQHLQQQSMLLSETSLYSGLNGGSGMGIGLSSGTDRFPSDLDLDIFNGSLDCDVDSIIRSDLMDSDGLDFNFDALVQNAVNLNPVGNFNGTKQSSQTWVPG